jgi:serine/alanine adding enzyme
VRPASSTELEHWDELVAANPDGGNPLQGRAFAATKAANGWEPRYIIHRLGQTEVAVLYLTRAMSVFGRLWYCPQGPGVVSVVQLQSIITDLKREQAFLIKLEPLLPGISADELKGLGLIKSARNIQPNQSTVVVDLEPSKDAILASFRQKTRYNVRLAERKGIIVKAVPTTRESMDQMYALMDATQSRNGFYLRDKNYTIDFWTEFTSRGNGQQFFAYYNEQVLAGAFVVRLGSYGLYKDGGSTREHSDLQAPHALQWEIITWLKDHSVTRYDLHGTPPASKLDDSTHPLAGLARFKTGFGSTVTEYAGVWDLVIEPSRYKLWSRLGEGVAISLELRRHKRPLY